MCLCGSGGGVGGVEGLFNNMGPVNGRLLPSGGFIPPVNPAKQQYISLKCQQ